MELFIDSVDLDEIRAALDFGFLQGITTTPTFMHREGIRDVDGAIVELSKIAEQLHVEALGRTCSEILAEAERISALPGLAKTPTFKIPVTNEGLKAAYRLTQRGEKTNIHLVYTLNQAYLAAESGAGYVCPLVGRLHDQGHDSFAMIEQAVNMVERYRYPTKIMVSSVRHLEHVRMAILCGAHAITVPWRVLRILSENVLTGRGISDFSLHTKLTTYTVRQIIRPANPVVSEGATVAEAAIEMTKSRLGAVSIVDGDGRLIGILTDGDLRRLIDRGDLAQEKVARLMSRNPRWVSEETLLQDALERLRQAQVDNLVVVDADTRPVGMIDVQDLLREGLIE
ncbi:MAG: CBS domain-containing protein [Deltaproteobacteria bacterium]|nr:CBS domain-containing protein [Deltaproteobacteria bacterium]MBW2121788.1 CBS domain-containing protein [Deltaproteobacteria bacterium]